MQYAIGITPLNPLRLMPSHKSEMVSQLLFGEPVEILEENKDFWRIRMLDDDYEGWVQASQICRLTEQQPADMRLKGYAREAATITIDQQRATIYPGTPIWDQDRLGDRVIDYLGLEAVSKLPFNEQQLQIITAPYFNASYLWGGRSTAGVDCSGFIQQVYKLFGYALPRDAYQQAERGTVVDFLAESTLGDLAFFDNPEGRIIHVGIIINKETILHASGRVRMDRLDAQGIVQEKTGERTHQLRIIKRVV